MQVVLAGVLSGMSAYSFADAPRYSASRFQGLIGKSDLCNLRRDWEAVGQDIHRAYLEEASKH